MKKTYLAPELEISLFEIEDVLGGSSPLVNPGNKPNQGGGDQDLPIIGL